MHVAAGTVRVTVGDESAELSAGDSCSCRTDAPHGIENPAPSAEAVIYLIVERGVKANARNRGVKYFTAIGPLRDHNSFPLCWGVWRDQRILSLRRCPLRGRSGAIADALPLYQL